MRIVSKFKDYYDYATAYRDDDRRSYYWERKHTQEIIDSSSLQKNFEQNHNWYKPRYVGLPSMEWDYGKTGNREGFQQVLMLVADTVVFFWVDMDIRGDVNDRYKKGMYSTEFDFEQFKISRWAHSSSKERVIDTVPYTENISKYPLLKEWQIKYKSPTIFVDGLATKNHFTLEINPRLADYHIQTVLEPQQVYQEIDMWFANLVQEPPPAPLTDKQKIVSHGLDVKTSFRHPIK